MPTIQEVREAFMENHGFDPNGIYCLATGKCIGWTHIEEIQSVINLIGGEESTAEEIADDLAIRVLGSMRPSIKWNKFRAESLAELRVSDPVETLAYLVNRMFAPLNHRKIGIESLLGAYADKIRAFQLLSKWGVTDATNTLTYMLLEIDAKWNLDTEFPPFNAYDFFFDCPTDEHRVAMLQAWYAVRMAAWEKRLKAEEMQTNWHRHGSKLAQPAFRDAFMESKPLSVTAIQKAEKAAEKGMFADLLFEIMGEPTLDGKEQKPHSPAVAAVFVPIKKMPRKFGVKK